MIEVPSATFKNIVLFFYFCPGGGGVVDGWRHVFDSKSIEVASPVF